MSGAPDADGPPPTKDQPAADAAPESQTKPELVLPNVKAEQTVELDDVLTVVSATLNTAPLEIKWKHHLMPQTDTYYEVAFTNTAKSKHSGMLLSLMYKI